MDSERRLASAEAEYLADMGWVGWLDATHPVPTLWYHPAMLARGFYVPTRLALTIQRFYRTIDGQPTLTRARPEEPPRPVATTAPTSVIPPEQQAHLLHAARPTEPSVHPLPPDLRPTATQTIQNLQRRLPHHEHPAIPRP